MRAKLLRDDHGNPYRHREPPSRRMSRPTIVERQAGITETVERWENNAYYGLVRRYTGGFPIGDGPYAVISLTALDETARHDWRDFQAIKNYLVGDEWEAVELYPAESRLRDPSNRFYLWCAPKGVFCFGLPGNDHRVVLGPEQADAPQRPFPKK